MKCRYCGKEGVTSVLGVCADCLRKGKGIPDVLQFHEMNREKNYPGATRQGNIKCNLCSNHCLVAERGRCGVIHVSDGKLRIPVYEGYLDFYLDPLPTNCCNDWFCPGCQGTGYPKYSYSNKGAERGYYNLAVFFYGCNFDCFYCQNWEHKLLARARKVSIDELVRVAMNKRVSCVCYFGGSPEPHLVYAINASKCMLERKTGILRICWEWNGCGNPALVRRAAELSLKSGGTIKFDLKAWSKEISYALTGVDNKQAYDNFKLIYEKYYNERPEIPLLSAATLLVPGYIDEYEVEGIARFLASLSPEIPYTLLAFYPAYLAKDLPVTSRKQAIKCYNVAKKYLRRVHIGNMWLLH